MRISRKIAQILSIIAIVAVAIIITVTLCIIHFKKKDKNAVDKTTGNKTQDKNFVDKNTQNITQDNDTGKRAQNTFVETNEVQKMRQHHFFTLSNPKIQPVNNTVTIDNKYHFNVNHSHKNAQNINLVKGPMPTIADIKKILVDNKLDKTIDENRILSDLNFLKQKNKSNTLYYKNIVEFNCYLRDFLSNNGPHYETNKFLTYYMNYKKSDFDKWEGDHNYIQYLFPGMHIGSAEPEKTLLWTFGVIFAVSDEYRHALKCFAYNYGLFLVDFSKKNNFSMKTHDNHNKKRITRVIRCLRLFGEYKVADAFFDLVKKFCSSGDEDPVVKKHWENALETKCLSVIEKNLDVSLR